MKKEEHRIGDIKAVEFLKNQRDGRKPVCIIDGIICFIDRNYRGKFIQEHSVWHVEINEIKDRVMVIIPVQEIKSAFENQREINQRMKLLATKYPKKHVKAKIKYPYKSQQERDMEKKVNILNDSVPMATFCDYCGWEGYDDEMKCDTCPKCGEVNSI